VLKAFLLLKLPHEPGHLYTCTRTHSQLASLAEAFEQLIDHDGVLIAMKSTLFGQVLRKLLFVLSVPAVPWDFSLYLYPQ
jgi:hypothetical protein